MFFPGETITHRFIIPFAANEIDKVIVSYKQNEAVMFEKIVNTGFTEQDQGSTLVEFQLSQGEGLLFADDTPFTVQLNVFTSVGTRHTSHVLSSSSGVQYMRDVIKPENLKIVFQPVNYEVENIGDPAIFTVQAAGAASYQWKYSVNDGEWKDCTNGTSPVFEIVSTLERIQTHKYKCIIKDLKANELSSDIVKINYTERGDE